MTDSVCDGELLLLLLLIVLCCLLAGPRQQLLKSCDDGQLALSSAQSGQLQQDLSARITSRSMGASRHGKAARV